jgi:hypothetical protein
MRGEVPVTDYVLPYGFVPCFVGGGGWGAGVRMRVVSARSGVAVHGESATTWARACPRACGTHMGARQLFISTLIFHFP